MGHGGQSGSVGRKRTMAAAGGLTLAASLITGASADAATFTVTSLSDSSTTAPYDPGTLRNALYQANQNPDADTIVFASGLSGTINVGNSGALVASSATDIQGP